MTETTWPPVARPYYCDDYVCIIHGDCREVVPTLGRFGVVLLDPPYGKVRGHFDEEWTNRPAMLKDCAIWRDLAVGAMKPNATLWWFAWPSLAGRIEALIADALNPLAHIVWLKPSAMAQKHCPEALRAPGPETERVLMFEHYGADNMALGESGYVAACDEARGHVFEPLRAYLASECEAAGHTVQSINAAWRAERGGGGGMAGHWLKSSQWALPTAENYAWLQRLCNGHLRREYGHLRREYEDLRREYEDLRREYEDLRRYYDCQTGDQKTDVWRFAPSLNRHGHPTEKPLNLISYMVRLSCRPGDVVLDFFSGSCTTGRACKDLRRRCVCVEREERYAEIGARRMGQEVLAL